MRRLTDDPFAKKDLAWGSEGIVYASDARTRHLHALPPLRMHAPGRRQQLGRQDRHPLHLLRGSSPVTPTLFDILKDVCAHPFLGDPHLKDWKEEPFELAGWSYPRHLAGRAFGVVVHGDAEPEKGFYYRSDHFNFAKQGVPALDPDSGVDYIGKPPEYAKQQRDEWNATRYHTPKDDMGQPLDFEAGAKFTQACFRFAYEVATEKQRPTWNVGDFFGDKFGRKAGR